MNELLSCPFCGGKAEVREESIMDYSYDESADYIAVRCNNINCNARGPIFNKMWFCYFSKHTVDEFRKNPALRARVEDEYAIYCKQVEANAVKLWNTRQGGG